MQLKKVQFHEAKNEYEKSSKMSYSILKILKSRSDSIFSTSMAIESLPLSQNIITALHAMNINFATKSQVCAVFINIQFL